MTKIEFDFSIFVEFWMELYIDDVFGTFDKITKEHRDKNRRNVKTKMHQALRGWQPIVKIPKELRTEKWQARQDGRLTEGSRKERRTARWLEIRQKATKKVEKLNEIVGYRRYHTNGISIYMDY